MANQKEKDFRDGIRREEIEDDLKEEIKVRDKYVTQKYIVAKLKRMDLRTAHLGQRLDNIDQIIKSYKKKIERLEKTVFEK